MSRRKIFLAIIIVVIVGVLGLLGYTIIRERRAVENLKIELVDVSIDRIGLTSCDISYKLKFTNPTEYDTPVFWIDSYSIYINNNYVGAGTLPPTKVPANSTIYKSTKITLEYEKVGGGVVSAIRAGKFTITIEGVIKAKILFDTIPVSVQFSTTYKKS